MSNNDFAIHPKEGGTVDLSVAITRPIQQTISRSIVIFAKTASTRLYSAGTTIETIHCVRIFLLMYLER